MSNRIFERTEHYRAAGQPHAFALAAFEARIDDWPAEWGSEFQAVIFGDFDPPEQRLAFDHLGISVYPEKLEGTVITSGFTVLRARVAVPEKSVAAVVDAARRLNLLVGVLSYANAGAPIRWWSHMTRSNDGSALFKLGEGDATGWLALIDLLPPEPRRKVAAALYWMRQPRNMMSEHDHIDHFTVFAGYWNAFECLIEAANLLAPGPHLSSRAKTEAICNRLQDLGGTVGPGDITALYHDIVNPPLRTRAEHALRVCGTADPGHVLDIERILRECLDYEPRAPSLYNIRNEIDHGALDVDDPETAMIVAARFPELWGSVVSLLQGVLRLNARHNASSTQRSEC